MHNAQSYSFDNAYNYKFQEQELQETGFYSYKWRNYMPDVGRFFNIDPLSEMYAYQSHYNFSENRVIDAWEIEGLEAYILNDQGDMMINGLNLSHTEYFLASDGTRDIQKVNLGTSHHLQIPLQLPVKTLAVLAGVMPQELVQALYRLLEAGLIFMREQETATGYSLVLV